MKNAGQLVSPAGADFRLREERAPSLTRPFEKHLPITFGRLTAIESQQGNTRVAPPRPALELPLAFDITVRTTKTPITQAAVPVAVARIALRSRDVFTGFIERDEMLRA